MAKSKKNSKIHLDITAEKRQKLESYHCTIEAGIAMIGGKYKIMILHHLMQGALRYNQIAKALPKATPKMLSQQLKELESDGIIKRTLYPVVPPKTEYNLTPLGEALKPVIESLCAWSQHYYELCGVEDPHKDKKLTLN
ncbi:winged helix-turn-helix transcriptional regulator [uncultured Helicobacter sp.]|uniref:winged helix-turn-helix transcriptional regulator n=1 Tax=uncultured Helicobacter sp. TaxID=175537 RepID=UPI00374F4327